MKKMKLIITLILIVMTLSISTSVVYAADPIGNIMDNADNFLKKDQTIAIGDMKTFSDIIYIAFLSIGTVIAVIVGIVLGMQYMYSSVEDKAKTKEHLVVYFIGCAVLFGAFGIWKIVVQIFNSI